MLLKHRKFENIFREKKFLFKDAVGDGKIEAGAKGRTAEAMAAEHAGKADEVREEQATSRQDLVDDSADKAAEMLEETSLEAIEVPPNLEKGPQLIDSYTGYKMYIIKPAKNWNGRTVMYLPGDRTPLTRARTAQSLLANAKERWRKNDRCALVAIEGSPNHIQDKTKSGEIIDKSKRYVSLKDPVALTSVIHTAEGVLGSSIKGINVIGYSRGGSGIDHLLASEENRNRISSVGFLDATYALSKERRERLEAFARSGKRVSIAFKRGSRTEEPAMQYVEDLDLPETSPGVYTNGTFTVYATNINHGRIASDYFESFMALGYEDYEASGVPLEATTVPEAGRNIPSSAAVLRETYEEGGEEYLKDFSARMEIYQKDEKKMTEFLDWSMEQEEYEMLRKGGVSKEENEKDPYEKHVRLSSIYLKSAEKIDAKQTYDVDFKGNFLAEWKVGAGHMLPPTVKAISVYDKKGNLLCARAERDIKDKRVGYYDVNTGEYAYVHTGFRIKILQVEDPNSAVVKKRIAEEKALFDVVLKENDKIGQEKEETERAMQYFYPNGDDTERVSPSGESLEIDPDEEFVKHKDPVFGNRIVLRNHVMTQLLKAQEIASKMDPPVWLKIGSSFRSIARQEELFREEVVKRGGDEDLAADWVARPGKSEHHSGGAIDVYVMTKGKHGEWVGGKWHENQKLLWKIMPQLGFVNYYKEPWHWAIGNPPRSKKVTGKGLYYRKERDLKISRLRTV